MGISGNSVIILAAGIGSRLQSSLPKVFHKIGGLTLLDHVIKAAKGINPAEIVAVLNPKYNNVDLKFSSVVKRANQAVPRGTADAVKYGLKLLSDDSSEWVYVLYGDIPLISSETLQRWFLVAEKCIKTAIVILAMNSDKDNDLGKLELANEPEVVQDVVEANDAPRDGVVSNLCNAGLLIKKSLLREFIGALKPNPQTGEFYITDMVRLACEAGYVCRYYEGDRKELLGANTRAELATLEKVFQDRERAKHLNSGVALIAPETVFFSHDTHIERDVTVYPYVVFGENVHIRSGAQVGPFCVIEGATIGNAKVGPFTRLRAGTDIRNGVKVGNFVEVKNSVIAENSRVSHLSYIGDASLGRSVNVGAGTITCNYDGFKKHKTEIGDDVFIGSNTALVAPVKVQDHSMVGAGSVVVSDVASGALAIARGSQKNIENGAINFRRIKKCAES
ncbi:MAG: bifunctional UDP-N-acetylglucosamine diphosphorylase/glucosamine-1-phosphate N-acetyltransferase GlmU [Holosporaceae bacterium]|jgi:bifunctional UDP-N-acetylglucosamine pyrophosphorylase/glucosamine-1-phosphate N-acetyltransferase|nr:bifunctional UDP-N-acetylglucosamine diphosphorylase/glucosamine-1-phosphate N-acetyltransferase GlmU [Holosporaceae bacterium]